MQLTGSNGFLPFIKLDLNLNNKKETIKVLQGAPTPTANDIKEALDYYKGQEGFPCQGARTAGGLEPNDRF